MGPLTKHQLEQVTRDFSAWRDNHAPADAPASQPVTPKAGPNASLITGIIESIAPYIHELQMQVEALQKRVAELEESSLKYCGVYQPSASYQRGHVVTHDGSAFHAVRATNAERPGNSDAWQLMVKHGKDAATVQPRSDTTVAAARNGHATARARP
jgi:hypothetical protein